jgi:hypothetical protein
MLTDPRIKTFKEDKNNESVDISEKRIKESIINAIKGELAPEIDSIKGEIDGWIDYEVEAFLLPLQKKDAENLTAKENVLSSLSTKMDASGRLVIDRQALPPLLKVYLNSENLASDIIRVAGKTAEDGTRVGTREDSSKNYNLNDPQLKKYMEQQLLMKLNQHPEVQRFQNEALVQMNAIRDEFKRELQLDKAHVARTAVGHSTDVDQMRRLAMGQGLSVKASAIKKYIDSKLEGASQQAKDLLKNCLLADLKANRQLTMDRCKELNSLSGEARSKAFTLLPKKIEFDVSFLDNAAIEFDEVNY